MINYLILQQQFHADDDSLERKPHLIQTTVATTKVSNDPKDARITDNDVEPAKASIMFTAANGPVNIMFEYFEVNYVFLASVAKRHVLLFVSVSFQVIFTFY